MPADAVSHARAARPSPLSAPLAGGAGRSRRAAADLEPPLGLARARVGQVWQGGRRVRRGRSRDRAGGRALPCAGRRHRLWPAPPPAAACGRRHRLGPRPTHLCVRARRAAVDRARRGGRRLCQWAA
eukprot:3116668-Prymnesium_polylepis.1